MPDPEPTQPPQEPPQQQQQERFPSSWEEIFQHPRFKELNQKAQSATAELERIQAEEKKRNDEALKEQNKWKELYDGTQKELSTERINNLRLKIASSKGLPVELVERLRGETEDEIAKDAEGLLLLFKQDANDKSKGLPRTRNQQQTNVIDFATETDPKKIREAYRTGQHNQ